MSDQVGQKREVLEMRLKEKLDEQVARGQKEVQEARKELEITMGHKEVLEKKLKEQMKVKVRQRLVMVLDICDRNRLLARRKRELADAKEHVVMLRGELARCGAAPGGSWSRRPPLRPVVGRGGNWRQSRKGVRLRPRVMTIAKLANVQTNSCSIL